MRVLFLAFSLFLVPPAAQAEKILVNSSHGGIYVVDIETLAVAEYARGPQLFDIAVSRDGDILGVAGSGQLWRIDRKGAHWPLGAVGAFVNALTFDADGGLIGAGGPNVVGISPEDGTTRLLGEFAGFYSSGDVAFGPNGALYATGSPGPQDPDTLFRMDPGTGMKAIGPIGFANVYGLVWSDRSRALIGVTEARELIVIDPATGAGRLLGKLSFAGRGYGAAAFGGGPETISRLDRARPAGAGIASP